MKLVIVCSGMIDTSASREKIKNLSEKFQKIKIPELNEVMELSLMKDNALSLAETIKEFQPIEEIEVDREKDKEIKKWNITKFYQM